MILRRMQKSDLPRCSSLAYKALLQEKASVPVLPVPSASVFEPLLSDLLAYENAFAAEDETGLCGYLCFSAPFDGAFGNCTGVFSPVHAAAFSGKDPVRTLERLLSYAIGSLYRSGVTGIALSRYAHEHALHQTLVLNGFGARCCDLMRATCAGEPALRGYTFRTMRPDDLPAVLDLYNALERHMTSSPVLMPKPLWTAERLLPHINNVLLACKENEPIACLLLDRNGETYLDSLPSVMHISSTFCHPAHRGSGVMAALADYACSRMHTEGYTHLGVDCETINPPAYHFWRKQFSPFTYSFVRRLDERLLSYSIP